MARLLEEPGAATLCLAKLFGRLAVRVGDELAGLVAGRGDDLVALTVALVAEAQDLGLPLLKVDLLLADLLLGSRELSGGRILGVALEDVGELGSLADQVERVHADGMTARLDLARAACGLEDAKLGLQLDGVAAEGLEGVAYRLLVEASLDRPEDLEPRQRRHRRRRLARCSWSLYRHSVPPSRFRVKYAHPIGGPRAAESARLLLLRREPDS